MAPAGVAVALTAVHTPRPGLCATIMACGDAAAVALAITAAVLVRHAFGGDYEPALYWRLAGLFGLFSAGYMLFGLYPGIAHNAVREIRQLTLATTLVFIVLGSLTFLFKEAAVYSRTVFLIGWLLAIVLVPLARAQLRSRFGRSPWWGYPVAVFASGGTAPAVVRALRSIPDAGLHPVAIFQSGQPDREYVLDIPVLGDFHAAPLHAWRMGLKHAIVAAPELDGRELTRLIETHANMFPHIYIIPRLAGFSSLGIETRDLGDTILLDLRRSLLLPGAQIVKRITDQTISITLGLLAMPLMLSIAILIQLGSRGGVLYWQKRIGHGGRQFKMWKFRTMYADGDRILEAHFRAHPHERLAWIATRKLRNDPRVTPLGRLLRKTSLDELPQLWNVFRGQMSLVGPRPIVNDEITKYGAEFGLYCRVTPGLTGLWQVSGRSQTDYDRRVELDTYYVRNWSPWLDVYILARTVRTVLKGDGAY
jgi:Undecaprenyl-phosphate galactose phosphotransferase WbaP